MNAISKSLQPSVINWKPLIQKYKGLWVALDSDEETVISYGKKAKEVHGDALKKGSKTPILFKVPSVSKAYIG